MRTVTLELPELAFVVATRAALGAGIGLLAAGVLRPATRKQLGATLIAVGAATTVPALLLLRRRIKISEGVAGL